MIWLKAAAEEIIAGIRGSLEELNMREVEWLIELGCEIDESARAS